MAVEPLLPLRYAYSIEAEGAFVELSLRPDVVLFEEQVMLSSYILEGFYFWL